MPQMKGLYAHLFIVAYRPLSFSREVRVNMFAGHLILLPSLGVYLMLLISKYLLIYIFYFHILWIGIFFQEIVHVHDPQNLYIS